jgi:hypothetical protein
MNRVMMFLFSKTRLGKIVDGKKTVIGAVFIIAAAALQALENLAPLFPNQPWLSEAISSTRSAVEGMDKFMEAIGLGFLTVGVLHKSAKSKSES